MFAIASPAINSTALAPSPAVLAAPVVDAVSTRQTTAAVPAPLSDTQLADDNQGHATIAAGTVAGDSAAAAQTSSAATPPSLAGGGPSTPFLAQLISQNEGVQEDSQIGFLSSFSHFLPAPQYNQLVGYSVVKFRPSNAGLPSFYANLAAESADETAAGTPVASEYGAYSATQTRNQSNLANSDPQISTAG